LEEGDFHALSEGLDRDPQYDDRRLLARRKLAAVGKEAVSRIQDVELSSRTSLHRPHTFNGMRVRRLWVYVTRGKKWKTKLKKVLGADLAKDLDAAYRNAYLCVALEGDVIETSLRIHVDAWYDSQNLSKRLKREGLERWLELLNELDGYRLRLADWQGEWRCGELDRDKLEDFLSFWKPGEHALSIEKRWPAPANARAHAFAPEVPETLVAELVRLVPLYRFTAWSSESDFLFGG
jgi:hypothetical protein